MYWQWRKKNNYFSSDTKRTLFTYRWALAKRGVSLKNGAPSEKWLTLFKNDEWGWSLTATAGDKSHNPTSNDVETKDGLERSDSKQTGRQTNEHLKYGREFYCTLFRIFTCCKEVHVISKNPSQVKHTIYANQMSI